MSQLILCMGSEALTAANLKTGDSLKSGSGRTYGLNLQNRSSKQQDSPKCWLLCTRLHDITSQGTVIFIIANVFPLYFLARGYSFATESEETIEHTSRNQNIYRIGKCMEVWNRNPVVLV
jgi:hypothetical protein